MNDESERFFYPVGLVGPKRLPCVLVEKPYVGLAEDLDPMRNPQLCLNSAGWGATSNVSCNVTDFTFIN